MAEVEQNIARSVQQGVQAAREEVSAVQQRLEAETAASEAAREALLSARTELEKSKRELKQRGQLARNLLAEKDAEINRLRTGGGGGGPLAVIGAAAAAGDMGSEAATATIVGRSGMDNVGDEAVVDGIAINGNDGSSLFGGGGEGGGSGRRRSSPNSQVSPYQARPSGAGKHVVARRPDGSPSVTSAAGGGDGGSGGGSIADRFGGAESRDGGAGGGEGGGVENNAVGEGGEHNAASITGNASGGGGSRETIDSHRAEQQILQMARVQAQRDEETGRLRQKIQKMSEEIRERERRLEARDDEKEALRRRIQDLKGEATRAQELLDAEHGPEKMTYLKNVVKKFVTSDGSERQRLVPVVATVLSFTPEETTEVGRAVAAANSSGGTKWGSMFGS